MYKAVMSSFASLFGSTEKDTTVDSLFKNAADGPVSRDQLPKGRTVIEIPQVPEEESKEEKDEESEEDESSESNDAQESIEEDNSEEEEESEEDIEEKKSKKKAKKKAELNEDLEASYFDKLLRYKKDEENPAESESAEQDDDEEKKEILNLKAERTVFVGNVPADVVTSKHAAKLFKNLFKEFGKVESIRYRSISFDESLPRKIAIAKKNLHKSRDSVNAYVVFTDKGASRSAIALNATKFEDHHLRVDHVAHPSPKDNRRTIFVGNLDFEEKEDTLWNYFNSKLDNDVESVRIIRDSKTNMGKGFALVQFKDTLSVNKALFLNDKPIETGDKSKKGRKLRISRAKAHAKPSLMSPNHIDNIKKKHASKKQALSDTQKTKLGRAKTVLGKADRSTVGKVKKSTIMEGQRATKGDRVAGIKGLKGKVKKPRISLSR
ncbi:NOP12 [[Candida] subhashii]|uniref:Nucleolar protein 12 n=1 Tax=[Candida] subhashii TaxID=561895 RepID=A0A8J5UNW7_9ASCO|nr:NOP12 [[Candida] subhashii]KAG7663916.1 NOP12 [[Candida] subhashii]